MPRPLRVDRPNLCHHVMARGNNKASIFLDGEDYEAFGRLLSARVERYRIAVYAWCWMHNHIHLLVRTIEGGLSLFMGALLSIYARRFNRRHGRVGHVYQDRFRSKLVASNDYLIEVARYIHMNPVKAGIVRRPELYPWSSFPSLFGGEGRVPVDRGLYEQRFPGYGGPKDLYRFTIARRLPNADEEGWPDQPDWYVDERGKGDRETEELRAAPSGDPEAAGALLADVARRFGCTVERLTHAWRDPRLGAARAAAMRTLRDEAGLTPVQIASLLNLRNPRSVSNALRAWHA